MYIYIFEITCIESIQIIIIYDNKQTQIYLIYDNNYFHSTHGISETFPLNKYLLTLKHNNDYVFTLIIMYNYL